MHDVVEMLLTRIKDYPEDFVEAPNGKQYGVVIDDQPWNKWREARNTAYKVATDEEKLALDEATTAAKRAIYMGAALKTIMSDEVVREEPETMKMKSSGRYTVQGLQGPTAMINATSSAQNAQTLDTQYRQQLAQAQMQSYLNSSALGQA